MVRLSGSAEQHRYAAELRPPPRYISAVLVLLAVLLILRRLIAPDVRALARLAQIVDRAAGDDLAAVADEGDGLLGDDRLAIHPGGQISRSPASARTGTANASTAAANASVAIPRQLCHLAFARRIIPLRPYSTPDRDPDQTRNDANRSAALVVAARNARHR